MSGAPIIRGTSQLPKPPIIAGMIMKNTMIRPWPVTNTLKVCGSLKICRPGYISSARIIIDRKPPMQARDDREDQIHRADIFVVGRIDVAPPARRMVGRTMGRRGGVGWREKVRLACRFEAHVHPIDQRRRVARTPAWSCSTGDERIRYWLHKQLIARQRGSQGPTAAIAKVPLPGQ